ncbi:hypothetical protein G9A89_021042 [Geosiphon pyriformis]|nr:hypothetical protein G9A89_021042 [Geosiphon pyriformis]
MVKKTKSSEKWEQLLASAIVTPNSFVVSNEILDEIFIVSSGMLFKMGQDQPLAVLLNIVFSGRLLLVLEAKQSLPLVSGATSDGAWKTITSRQRFTEWVASILVPNAIFKIKLAHVKTVFQLVHGFLGAKSVLKDNVKLFCMEFASQVSLEAAFLVELTSSVYLAILKIAKFLVVLKSGSLSATVALHNVPLGVFAADIKTALSVFGIIIHVVIKPVVLVTKDSVWILLLVNQQETIVSHDKFKAKLVNLFSGCTVFEISDMVS